MARNVACLRTCSHPHRQAGDTPLSLQLAVFSQGFDWMGRGPYNALVPLTATLRPAATYRLMGAISSDRMVEAWIEDVATGARVSAPAAARARENVKPVVIPPLPPKR